MSYRLIIFLMLELLWFDSKSQIVTDSFVTTFTKKIEFKQPTPGFHTIIYCNPNVKEFLVIETNENGNEIERNFIDFEKDMGIEIHDKKSYSNRSYVAYPIWFSDSNLYVKKIAKEISEKHVCIDTTNIIETIGGYASQKFILYDSSSSGYRKNEIWVTQSLNLYNYKSYLTGAAYFIKGFITKIRMSDYGLVGTTSLRDNSETTELINVTDTTFHFSISSLPLSSVFYKTRDEICEAYKQNMPPKTSDSLVNEFLKRKHELHSYWFKNYCENPSEIDSDSLSNEFQKLQKEIPRELVNKLLLIEKNEYRKYFMIMDNLLNNTYYTMERNEFFYKK